MRADFCYLAATNQPETITVERGCWLRLQARKSAEEIEGPGLAAAQAGSGPCRQPWMPAGPA